MRSMSSRGGLAEPLATELTLNSSTFMPIAGRDWMMRSLPPEVRSLMPRMEMSPFLVPCWSFSLKVTLASRWT